MGFVKGFPHCVPREGTTNLRLEKGPAWSSIHVSNGRNNHWGIVVSRTLGKGVLQRECGGLHSLTGSSAGEEYLSVCQV